MRVYYRPGLGRRSEIIPTGEKLHKLESNDKIKEICQFLSTGKVELNESHREALRLIQEALLIKSRDAIAPISGANYSSIQVYSKENQLSIHAGANIDPSSIELLKSRKHRNCAEKQAAISAASEDLLSNAEMQIMFLYRRQEEKLKAEKLLPCIDCYETYINDLIKNKGLLILIIDDNETREFVNDENYDNAVQTLGGINYKIIDSTAMQNLNVEKILGGRVCAEHQH